MGNWSYNLTYGSYFTPIITDRGPTLHPMQVFGFHDMPWLTWNDDMYDTKHQHVFILLMDSPTNRF